MNHSKFIWTSLSLAILASCGGKDDNKIDNPDGPQGSGTMQEMTPEESKEFLQNAATDFLNLFNPQDQKQAIDLAGYFASEYGDFEAPAEFEIEPDGQKRTPSAYIKAIGDAAKGDLDALTRAAMSYSYTIKFDKLAGVYEPSSKDERWVKTGNSKDIVFKFSNKSGQPVELKVAQSGEASNVDFSIIDWDYEYDYETGSYNDFEVKYNYFLSIPKNVTASLTENGKEIASSSVVSSIDIDGHKINADVNASLMNLKAIGKVDGSDSKVEARADFFVSGDKVADTYATVTGNHLCDKTKYEYLEDLEDDQAYEELAKMFKTGDCAANVLDKVQVYGQIEYYKQLPDDLGSYWDYYDGSKDEARIACQSACERLNKHVKTQLRYNQTKTDQATIQFAPFYDEWSSSDWGWEYYVSANLLFPDKTTYDIGSYFERFTNVTNKWNSLLSAYEKIWETAASRK